MKKHLDDIPDNQRIQELERQIAELKSIPQRIEKNVGEDDFKKFKQKADIVDRAYQKKGFLFYWFVKMPMQNFNIGSLKQNQKAVNDAVRSVASPNCPKCSKNILMYDKNEKYSDGTVDWFCSGKTCDYTVRAKSSFSGFYEINTNSELHSSVLKEGRERWEKLTEEEKLSLIKEHLSKARIYQIFTIMVLLVSILQIVIGSFWGLILAIPLFLVLLLISLSSCYRAWQVRTGQVFLKKSPFFNWLKTAKKYYSVDWVSDLDCKK